MERIKKYRAQSEMSQFDLANYLGCSRQHLNFLESDKCYKLNEEMENKLCSLFGCNLIELYGYDNLKKKPKNDDEIIQQILFIFKKIEDANNKAKLIRMLEKL